MSNLRKEIESVVNSIKDGQKISEISFLDYETSNTIRVQIEVVTKTGYKFPYKFPIKSSNNCEEIKSVFKDTYPEYFI